LLNCFEDLLEHSVRISQNVIVPEPQDPKPALLQISITCLISLILGVLASICFDDKHVFETDEINDPGPDGNLSVEFRIYKLPRT